MSVYFAQRRRGGPIKIGWSRSVPLRVRSLKARLLGSIEGERAMEGALHSRFAHLRVHGEWYRPKNELLEYIRSRAQDHVPDASVRQTAIRFSRSIVRQLDALARKERVTRSEIMRRAMNLGLDQLENEYGR